MIADSCATVEQVTPSQPQRHPSVNTRGRLCFADRIDALSPADAIEPLTVLSDQAEVFVRRAEHVLRVPLGSPPHRS